MQKYFITTDLTADYPSRFAEVDFEVMDMSYVLDGVLYDKNNSISRKEFYSRLSSGSTANTSMVSADTAQAFFENILSRGYDLLHVSFSSALSGCYDAYVTARDNALMNYPDRKLIVIDSLCAAPGEGLLVYYALRKRDEGASIEECADYALQLRHHIGHVFTVDDMFYLYRGGRVSRSTAIVGQALQVKPVLMVSSEGALVPTNTTIGRRLAFKTMVDKMESKGKGYDNAVVFIGHCDAFDDANILKDMIQDRLGNQNVVITEISPIVGAHLGKGGLTLHYLCSDKVPFAR